MYERLRSESLKYLKTLQESKERALILATVALTVVLTLWIAISPGTREPVEAKNSTFDVPKGFLIIPIDILNAGALTQLVGEAAVVDVFRQGDPSPLAQNLRVIRLSHDEASTTFGALVPEKIAGYAQVLFSKSKIRAAVRTLSSGPTKFRLKTSTKPLLQEFSTGE